MAPALPSWAAKPLTVALLAESVRSENFGMATAAKIPMITITMISSIRVKPADKRRRAVLRREVRVVMIVSIIILPCRQMPLAYGCPGL